MTIRFAPILVALGMLALLTGCESGVLVFPTPQPAKVRFVNVTSDIATVRVVVDAATTVDVARGDASDYTDVGAGRQVAVVVTEPDPDPADATPSRIFVDTTKYTFGEEARVILFVFGDTTGTTAFRREIQDTVLPSPTSTPVIRFTHMALSVDKAYFVDVFITGGRQLFANQEFSPGISASTYEEIEPGTYTFELRESGTTNVVAILRDVTIEAGRPYMLYSYDAAPPELDAVALSIF
jgi:hypothetical protein